MKKLVLISLFSGVIVGADCEGDINYQIITGSKTGTYYKIGLDLAQYVAPNACIKLDVKNSNGSLDNAYKLISPKYPKLKFAIVQNDVLQELEKRANNGDKKASILFKKLRVIRPLYNEEIHIIARANDDTINSFTDLKDKRLAIGKPKSGTALTSLVLYRELFGKKLDLKKTKAESFKKSLKDLKNNKIDAIIKVAGQPVYRLQKKMQKDANKLIKLVPYDEKSSNVKSYYTADIYADSYPWLNENIPTLTTKAFLITYNYTNKGTINNIYKFAKSLQNKLSYLQENANDDSNTPHPKWKQISSECLSELPGNWKYHGAVIKACNDLKNNPTKNNNVNNCTEEDKILGLCDDD